MLGIDPETADAMRVNASIDPYKKSTPQADAKR